MTGEELDVQKEIKEMKQYTFDELVSIIENSPIIHPKFCLFGIRNKSNNKIVTIGELDKTLIYGWTESIKGAKVWDSECVAKEVFEMLSQDKEFAKNHFVDQLTKEETNEYLGGTIWTK